MNYAIGCRSGMNNSEGHKVTCGITPQTVSGLALSWPSTVVTSETPICCPTIHRGAVGSTKLLLDHPQWCPRKHQTAARPSTVVPSEAPNCCPTFHSGAVGSTNCCPTIHRGAIGSTKLLLEGIHSSFQKSINIASSNTYYIKIPIVFFLLGNARFGFI